MNSEIHPKTINVNCNVVCNCAKIVQTRTLLVIYFEPASKDGCFCRARLGGTGVKHVISS